LFSPLWLLFIIISYSTELDTRYLFRASDHPDIIQLITIPHHPRFQLGGGNTNFHSLGMLSQKKPGTDTLSPTERSERMGRVRGKDTKPELAVRRLVFSLGYRYRLHDRNLPGCPDIVFPSRKKVIFVHGCFWHRHKGCPNTRLPKSRLEFWVPKLEENKRRDKMNKAKLTRKGWRYLVIWECELKDSMALSKRIIYFLEG